MRFFLRVILFISFCLSQSIQILVDKNIIEKNESITLSIESKNSKEFPLVDLSILEINFDILSGPSQQTNIQWINGVMNSAKTLTWTISPRNEGEILIPSLNINLDGKELQSNAIKIIVRKKNNESNSSIYIKAEIDKNEAYLGEQITLTYKLYKNINASIEPFQMPEFPGFWIEDIFTPKRLNYQQITLKGMRYQVAKLGQKALFPMISDKHSIPSLKIKANIELKKKRRNRDPFFDPFFDSFFTESKIKFLKSEELDIKIKDLPLPIPEDYNGAVGEFSLTSNIDRDTIKVNEGFIYSLKLEGSGNLGLFSIPKLDFPNQIEVFPPVDKFEKDIFRNQLTGSQTWEYMLIPRISGPLKIPGINMSYFNPDKDKWAYVKTEPILIEVINKSQIVTENSSNKKEEINLLRKDIRFISEDIGKIYVKGKHNYGLIIFFYFISVILLLSPILIERFLGYRLSNLKSRNSQKALKNGLNLLLDKTLEPHDACTISFYNYLINKMSLNTSQLDPSIVESLLKNKISNSLLEKVNKILRICETNKYGFSKNMKENNLRSQMAIILKEIDKKLYD